jgi:hypothetical protein
VWALARIRFLFKPRRRIWNQTGVKELVTITAPKRVEKVYTDGLSQTEVRSRLEALAQTIDSRGWAIKNTNINMTTAPQYANPVVSDDSDRLINPLAMPQEVPTLDIQAADDILDERNNPFAQRVDQMISASTKARRQELMEKMRNAGPSLPPAVAAAIPTAANPTHWFMPQPATAPTIPAEPATIGTLPIAGIPTAEEAALVERAKVQNSAKSSSYSHLKTIDPAGAHPSEPPQPVSAVPATPDAVILDLARSNDLDVATLSREARRSKEPPEDEVVIPLR